MEDGGGRERRGNLAHRSVTPPGGYCSRSAHSERYTTGFAVSRNAIRFVINFRERARARHSLRILGPCRPRANLRGRLTEGEGERGTIFPSRPDVFTWRTRREDKTGNLGNIRRV